MITIRTLSNLTESELRALTQRHYALELQKPTPLPMHWMLKGEWVKLPPDVTKQVAGYYARMDSAQLMWSFGRR